MAATEVQDASLRSEHKKWVLKVSIDCAGCGKKVRKALHGIEGVHSTEIDLKQQKVTVIGNVDAGTLIRRLVKTTKKAVEVCPDESPAAKNKPEKGDIKANRDADKNRDLQTEVRSEDPSSSNSGGAPAKDTSSDAPSKDGDGDCAEKKSDSDSPEKKSDGSSGLSSPASGNGGKKKKRKGQKRNVDVADGASAPNPTHAVAPSPPTSEGQTAVNQPSNPSPPRQPAHQHAPPPPVLSYNMAPPTGFSSASYYSPPPALSSYSYAYDVPGVEMGPPRPPSYYYYTSYPPPPPPPNSYQHPSQPPEFELFSEENPNACMVM